MYSVYFEIKAIAYTSVISPKYSPLPCLAFLYMITVKRIGLHDFFKFRFQNRLALFPVQLAGLNAIYYAYAAWFS